MGPGGVPYPLGFGTLSGTLALALTAWAERRRNRRVERDDLRRLDAGELGSGSAWEAGLRWAAGRGDVSPRVAERAGLEVATCERRAWRPAAFVVACAAAAWKTSCAAEARPANALVAASLLACAGCAALTGVALLDAWHHEIDRALLVGSTLSLVGSSVLGGATLARAGAALLLGGVTSLCLALVRARAPSALGTGDVLLLGCQACVVAASSDPSLAAVATVAAASAVALMAPDPAFPDRVPCAAIAALAGLAA